MRTGPTETRHWLYQLIEAENPGQQPQFASKSTVNWARSLALEIQAEHGELYRKTRADRGAGHQSFPFAAESV